MKDSFKPLIIAVIILCLLLLIFSIPGLPWTKKDDAPKPTQPPAADTELESEAPQNTDPSRDAALVRYVNYGDRDYLKKRPVQMVSFPDMVYTRPDAEAFSAACRELAALSEQDAKAKELLQGYYDLYDLYTDIYTMDTLAEIRYSMDVTDAFYAEEYEYCESILPTVEEGLELVYKAYAACPQRQAMERLYFGDGFFLYYDDHEVYTNETYLRLSQQEAALLSEYRSLMEDPQITWEGKKQSLWDLQADADYDTYYALLDQFYEEYNPRAAEIFIQLVRVRSQLAKALGYENYAQMAFEMTYDRDYTPDQCRTLIRDIQTQLLPVYQRLLNTAEYYILDHWDVTEEETYQVVQSAAEALGGAWADAFRFMDTYQLCDISQAAEKEDISYQSYLYSYEAPVLIVNAQGDSSDFTSFAHEFGHFTEAYYTYCASEDLETAETYSQATEFLALEYTAALSDRDRERLKKLKLIDSLETFLSQASYASFEEQVYTLPDEELTADRLNEIFRQVNRDYGGYEADYDAYYSLGWIDVTHFFTSPFYVISYCVSADTALQIYQRETAEPGAGVDAFNDLLDRGYTYGVQEVMEQAGLENPFAPGRMKSLADFFLDRMNLR